MPGFVPLTLIRPRLLPNPTPRATPRKLRTPRPRPKPQKYSGTRALPLEALEPFLGSRATTHDLIARLVGVIDPTPSEGRDLARDAT